METKKIYIVTCGEYSSYCIDRVFSTRKLAEEYLDTVDDDYEIEEYNIDEPIERKTEIFEIGIRTKDKQVLTVQTWCSREKDMIVYCTENHRGEMLKLYVESDSRERAIKIASERFGQVFANEQVMYPYLRTQVIKKYGGGTFPIYNFKTGAIIVFDDTQFVSKMPEWVKTEFVDNKYGHY